MNSHSIAASLLGLLAVWCTGCTNEVEPLVIDVDPSEIIKVDGLPPPLRFSETLGTQVSDVKSIRFMAIGYDDSSVGVVFVVELFESGKARLKIGETAYDDLAREIPGTYQVQEDKIVSFSFNGIKSLNMMRFQLGKNARRLTLIPSETPLFLADQVECFRFQEMTKDLGDVSRLQEFAGKDVRKLPEEQYQEIQLLATNFFTGEERRKVFPIETWYIWKPESSDVHLVLFQGSRLRQCKSYSHARLFLLDEKGLVLGQHDLSLYDENFLGAKFVESKDQLPYVRIDTGDGRQFMAIQDNDYHLVRVKRFDGALMVPSGEFSHPVTRVPNESWKTKLLSSKWLDVLTTLTAEPEWPLRLIYEDKEAKPIVKRLTNLTKSDDKWIQEAAAIYLEIFKEPEKFSHLISRWRSRELEHLRNNEIESLPAYLKSNSCD